LAGTIGEEHLQQLDAQSTGAEAIQCGVIEAIPEHNVSVIVTAEAD
jgi:hypothetical protein